MIETVLITGANTGLGKITDPMIPYGPIKYMAALWMSSIARSYPDIRFVTMSPGGTFGTKGFDTLSSIKKVMFKRIFRVLLLLGKGTG